jgi:hypothetical protein
MVVAATGPPVVALIRYPVQSISIDHFSKTLSVGVLVAVL